MEHVDAEYQQEFRKAQVKAEKPICAKCGKHINTSTHSYSDLGGYECFEVIPS